MGRCLLLALLCGTCLAIPQVHVSLLSPHGLEFRVDDEAGLEEVGLHYNINTPFQGTEAAQNNYEVMAKSADGYWHHRDTLVTVHQGDTVYYWIYYKENGVGQVKGGYSWTAGHGGQTQAPAHTQPPGGQGHTAAPTKAPSTPLRLIFQDDFHSSTVDTSKWKYEVSAFGGGNWEFQVYTNEKQNTYIKNNILYMKPTLTADKFGNDFLYHGHMDVAQIWGECTESQWYGCVRDGKDNLLPPIMSSKLISKVDFKYGRVEIVAQLPLGDWIWPAIWLMPRDFTYGGWPVSGEIDMVEARCNREYGDIGIKRMMSTLHWGTKPETDSWPKTTEGKILSQGTWADNFHTYTMDWSPTGILISVDGSPVLNRPTPQGGYFGFGNFGGSNPWSGHGLDAPFDQYFHFQMNVGVGGTLGFFPDGLHNADGPKPWCNTCPDAGRSNQKFWEAKDQWYPTWHGEKAAMKVKSVKIWSY